MSEASVKQRLKPGVKEFWNDLLPAYINSLPDTPVDTEAGESKGQTEGRDEL